MRCTGPLSPLPRAYKHADLSRSLVPPFHRHAVLPGHLLPCKGDTVIPEREGELPVVDITDLVELKHEGILRLPGTSYGHRDVESAWRPSDRRCPDRQREAPRGLL